MLELELVTSDEDTTKSANVYDVPASSITSAAKTHMIYTYIYLYCVCTCRTAVRVDRTSFVSPFQGIISSSVIGIACRPSARASD